MVRSRYFVQGCSNCTNKAAGISLHACESKRQRDLWVCFVRTKRKKILPLPKARFVVCSAHFEENCFTRAFDPTQRRQIKPGSLPSIWPQRGVTDKKRYNNTTSCQVHLLYNIHFRSCTQDARYFNIANSNYNLFTKINHKCLSPTSKIFPGKTT